jgi:hypothetical protein
MYYFDLDEIETGLMQHRKFLDSKSEILARDFWTTCQDKKGRNIFENDIVKHFQNRKEYKNIIRWDRDGWYVGNWNPGHLNDFDCEVIGNIYDNPELLKEQP